MSKGVFGEQLWLLHRKDAALAHHAPIIRNLIIATALGTLLLVAGLATRNLAATLTGLTLAMTAKLWFLDRMVWLYLEVVEGRTGDGVSVEHHN